MWLLYYSQNLSLFTKNPVLKFNIHVHIFKFGINTIFGATDVKSGVQKICNIAHNSYAPLL